MSALPVAKAKVTIFRKGKVVSIVSEDNLLEALTAEIDKI